MKGSIYVHLPQYIYSTCSCGSTDNYQEDRGMSARGQIVDKHMPWLASYPTAGLQMKSRLATVKY